MRTTALLTNDDDRRRSAEAFIRNTYAVRYGARLETFPSRMSALLDHRDEILCAAGLRFFDDGFFSERYLDTPIEDVVSAIHKVLLVNVAYFFDAGGRDISEVCRVLRSGGRLVIYVSSRETMEKWPCAGPETHRTFDARDLARLLEDAGFRRSHIMITHGMYTRAPVHPPPLTITGN